MCKSIAARCICRQRILDVHNQKDLTDDTSKIRFARSAFADCARSWLCHVAWLVHEPDDSRGNNLKGEQDDWYLTVMLDHFPFWKRLSTGLRYIFAPLSLKYGMTAELVLRSEDIEAACVHLETSFNRRLGS